MKIVHPYSAAIGAQSLAYSGHAPHSTPPRGHAALLRKHVVADPFVRSPGKADRSRRAARTPLIIGLPRYRVKPATKNRTGSTPSKNSRTTCPLYVFRESGIPPKRKNPTELTPIKWHDDCSMTSARGLARPNRNRRFSGHGRVCTHVWCSLPQRVGSPQRKPFQEAVTGHSTTENIRGPGSTGEAACLPPTIRTNARWNHLLYPARMCLLSPSFGGSLWLAV